MSKSDTFENDWLKLIFNGTGITGLADNAATSPLTNLYFALHSTDPGEAGNQSTNEVAYGSYARVAVARTTGGFTVTGGSVSTAAAVNFPTGTSGTAASAGFWSVGTAASGTGKILYSGTVSPAITYGNGIIPQLSTVTVTED